MTLVDISDTSNEEITRTGLRAGGKEYELDTIVFAIGFDAMTGPLLRIDIRGAGGRSLREKWADGPRTYLGIAIEGFPNLFTVTGPTSPSVLTSMVPTIEQHVEWISDCIAHARACDRPRIEATQAAEDAWMEHHEEVAAETLFPSLQLVVCGRQCPRQAPHGDALHGRLCDLYREVRRGCRQWLRGILSNYRLSDGLGVT